MNKFSFTSVIFLLFLLFSVSVFAQTPMPTATPPNDDGEVVKISTALIQLDVIVTDKKGNQVTDLKPEDFEIFENGEKQNITNFSYIFSNPEKRPTDSPTPKTTDKFSIPIPPAKLKLEQVRRTYAIVIDDLGLSFENVNWVQQSLKKFVNEQMQEGDLVAVIRTGSGIGALQSFTSDKRQLLAAINKIKWNPQGRGGISTFAAIGT
ncbi:MAG: VWA domain-containing protein, partial [Acidobacteria bacterium]|nr:VWA domain-containing protein [Acidobacteriota bacterium]